MMHAPQPSQSLATRRTCFVHGGTTTKNGSLLKGVGGGPGPGHTTGTAAEPPHHTARSKGRATAAQNGTHPTAASAPCRPPAPAGHPPVAGSQELSVSVTHKTGVALCTAGSFPEMVKGKGPALDLGLCLMVLGGLADKVLRAPLPVTHTCSSQTRAAHPFWHMTDPAPTQDGRTRQSPLPSQHTPQPRAPHAAYQSIGQPRQQCRAGRCASYSMAAAAGCTAPLAERLPERGVMHSAHRLLPAHTAKVVVCTCPARTHLPTQAAAGARYFLGSPNTHALQPHHPMRPPSRQHPPTGHSHTPHAARGADTHRRPSHAHTLRRTCGKTSCTAGRTHRLGRS